MKDNELFSSNCEALTDDLKISLSNNMEVEISRRQAVKFKTRFSI